MTTPLMDDWIALARELLPDPGAPDICIKIFESGYLVIDIALEIADGDTLVNMYSATC